MTPIERAARVLCDRAGRDPDEVCIGEGKATGQTWFGWEAFVSDARAVVEALREPSHEMLGDVHDTLLYHVRGEEMDTARTVWDRMIDALLDDGPQG
ncbi:MAG TPA: hypothetical protein VM662_16685 [Sphingomonas sp.]|nr:hypothetical protein [Sphingomonas sp.]